MQYVLVFLWCCCARGLRLPSSYLMNAWHHKQILAQFKHSTSLEKLLIPNGLSLNLECRGIFHNFFNLSWDCYIFDGFILLLGKHKLQIFNLSWTCWGCNSLIYTMQYNHRRVGRLGEARWGAFIKCLTFRA